MIKGIVIKFAKNYVVKEVNKLLDDKKESVENICGKITLWMNKIQYILTFLQKLNEKVADGKIEDEETKQITTDLEELIKRF